MWRADGAARSTLAARLFDILTSMSAISVRQDAVIQSVSMKWGEMLVSAGYGGILRFCQPIQKILRVGRLSDHVAGAIIRHEKVIG